MSEDNIRPGDIVWQDLTVADAPAVRDFYKAVVGWEASEVEMDGYSDYALHPAGDEDPVGGVCHARGENKGVPAQWLVYIAVQDVHESIRKCTELGGKVVDGPRLMGMKQFCVIQDPAGAYCALIGIEDADEA
jgi:uncharacterized protein